MSSGQKEEGYLQTVIEEEEGDVFAAVARLVSQGDGLNAVDQTTMGGQQVGLERGLEVGREGKDREWHIA